HRNHRRGDGFTQKKTPERLTDAPGRSGWGAVPYPRGARPAPDPVRGPALLPLPRRGFPGRRDPSMTAPHDDVPARRGPGRRRLLGTLAGLPLAFAAASDAQAAPGGG